MAFPTPDDAPDVAELADSVVGTIDASGLDTHTSIGALISVIQRLCDEAEDPAGAIQEVHDTLDL